MSLQNVLLGRDMVENLSILYMRPVRPFEAVVNLLLTLLGGGHIKKGELGEVVFMASRLML